MKVNQSCWVIKLGFQCILLPGSHSSPANGRSSGLRPRLYGSPGLLSCPESSQQESQWRGRHPAEGLGCRTHWASFSPRSLTGTSTAPASAGTKAQLSWNWICALRAFSLLVGGHSFPPTTCPNPSSPSHCSSAEEGLWCGRSSFRNPSGRSCQASHELTETSEEAMAQAPCSGSCLTHAIGLLGP